VAESTITEIPLRAVSPEKIVDYYGVTFREPRGWGGAGCHIYVYNEQAAAQQAMDLLCLEDVPRISAREVGEETCAFGYEIITFHATVIFRRDRVIVDVMTTDLPENEVWRIVEVMNSRLR
jgi:hypothetical protein